MKRQISLPFYACKPQQFYEIPDLLGVRVKLDAEKHVTKFCVWIAIFFFL